MWRVTFTGIRARKWRLLSTGIAIILGVAFIAGTAVLSDVLSRSVNDLVADAYRGIDAVVRSTNAQESPFSSQPLRDPVAASTLDLVREAKGVSTAEGIVQVQPTMLDKKGKKISAFGPPTIALNWVKDARLASGVLTSGREPRGADEVVMDFKTAKDLGFTLGDRVTLQFPAGSATPKIVGIGGLGSKGKKSTGSKIVRIASDRKARMAFSCAFTTRWCATRPSGPNGSSYSIWSSMRVPPSTAVNVWRCAQRR